MNTEHHQAKSAFDSANKNSRATLFAWVRTVISIITPSLVLLIGLQDKSQLDSPLSKYFLVASILLMSLVILSGLFVLRSESEGYRLLRDKVGNHWNKTQSYSNEGVLLSSNVKFFQIFFSCSTILSIIFLTGFGVVKYIT